MNTHKRTTLQDIADHLQLSRSSVALALRTTKTDCLLTPETWTLIHAAAEALGYRPNRQAQSLARGRAGCIGIIAHGTLGLGLFSGRLIEYLSREIAKRDQDLLIIDASGPESSWMGKLEDGRIDGAFLMPPAPLALIDLPKKPHLPLIAVNILAAGSAIPSIVPDDAGAIALAFAHLRGHGHRRIAYYVDARNNFTHHSTKLRQEAFTQECLNHGLPPGPVISHVPAAVSALQAFGTGPTALICYNDLDALRVSSACLAAGIRIPADASIVGINDDTYAESMTPGLTTISLEPGAIAQAACDALFKEIDGRNSPAGALTIPVKLLTRTSSGPLQVKNT